MDSSAPLFEINDLVAVFGGSADRDETNARQVLIAKVMLVGMQDLFVKEVNRKSFGKLFFKVPKSICVPISIEAINVVNDRILLPQLDDLVASISWDRFKEKSPEIITGILYKVFYSKGKPEKCLLLRNNEFEEASYESLMVLQRNLKKD